MGTAAPGRGGQPQDEAQVGETSARRHRLGHLLRDGALQREGIRGLGTGTGRDLRWVKSRWT